LYKRHNSKKAALKVSEDTIRNPRVVGERVEKLVEKGKIEENGSLEQFNGVAQ
jgi:hypothetical protein